MKEKPILFSGPMVQAILEGRKTQTRRIVKDQAKLSDLDSPHAINIHVDECGIACDWLGGKYAIPITHPYGNPGDRLWVRETWADNFSGHASHRGILYKATAAEDRSHHGYWAKETAPGQWVDHYDRPFNWKSSLFMPRGAARITLEITSIRVERLQMITERDAKAEGVNGDAHPTAHFISKNYRERVNREAFRNLWDEINGKCASWESNPWVWVVGLKRVER